MRSEPAQEHSDLSIVHKVNQWPLLTSAFSADILCDVSLGHLN
jgi:hypothetical protein